MTHNTRRCIWTLLLLAIFALSSSSCGCFMVARKGEKAPPPVPSPKTMAAPVAFVLTAPPQLNTEEYSQTQENPFLNPLENPLSTFSIDVDTASYANIRRFLRQNRMPPKDAVRIEEMVNYFSYSYPQPEGAEPISVTTEYSACPWNAGHTLISVALQGKRIPLSHLPPGNLVFLIDVSGSMAEPNRLPLLKQAFNMLVSELRPVDRVSIVVYASKTGLILPSTPGSEKTSIKRIIDSLEAGGYTAGGEAIQLAYKVAKQNYIKDGNNRVILATDGDFNVGISDTGTLVRFVEEKRKEGIYLSVLGFGMGNLKDNRMEQLADKGNGNYAYIDSLLEAKKVLVTQMTGTLFTIANDVKIQTEFNPSLVKAYRLIGYENRILKAHEFRDDKKDAGELGSGHTVTALYEIIPAGSPEAVPGVGNLKYQKTTIKPEALRSNELMTIRVRYKDPGTENSKERVWEVKDTPSSIEKTSKDFRFAGAVTEFCLLLRDSEYRGRASYRNVIQRARDAKGEDAEGYRAEFVSLAEIAELLDKKSK